MNVYNTAPDYKIWKDTVESGGIQASNCSFSKLFSTIIEHNLDFGKLNPKLVFVPSSLLCFPTSGTVSQYVTYN